MHILAFVFCLCVLFPQPLSAQEDPITQSIPENRDLKLHALHGPFRVIDGITLSLKDGSQYRLDQIDIPDHFRSEPGPIAAQAKTLLAQYFDKAQARVFIRYDLIKPSQNRLSQNIAHLENTDNVWAQGLLVSNGLARVIPSPELPEVTNVLMALEQKAREDKKGLWGDETYRIKTPETVQPSALQMQIVEGVVKKVATVRNTTYLNFGDDWRKDFTIQVPADLRRDYTRKGIDLLSYQGKTIQIRGYVEEYNGPLIKLESNAHLIVLSK